MNKQQLQNIFNKLIDEAFVALADVENKTKEQNEKLVSLTSEYVSLQDIISKAKKDILDERKNIEAAQRIHDDKVLDFSNEVNKFNKSKEMWESQATQLISQKGKLITDIRLMEEGLATLALKEKSKSIINEELTSLNIQLKDKKSELLDVSNKYSSLESSIREAQSRFEDINYELEKQKAIILPSVSSVNEREKLVAKREGDLQIIIDRYKKLYADKGVGFSI